MKLITNASCLVILFGSGACDAAMAAPSLCAATESVVFSCSTTASKTMSLCLDKRIRLMTYKFGTPEKNGAVILGKAIEQGGLFIQSLFQGGC